MSNGPSWFSWISFPTFAPFSGSVTQDISPSVYQGIPEIEVAIVREAGSFGTQLGIISKAVLELADALKHPSGDQALLVQKADGELSDIEKLRKLVVQIDDIKKRYKVAAREDVDRALDRLKSIDPKEREKFVGPDR